MYPVLDYGSSSKYKISLFRRPNSLGSCVAWITYLSCEVFCSEFDFSLASPAVGMALASHDFLHKQETEDLTTSSWRNGRKNRLYTSGTQLKACTACHFSKRSVCFRSAYSRSFILSQSEPSKNSKSKCPGLKSVSCKYAWQKDVSHQVPC